MPQVIKSQTVALVLTIMLLSCLIRSIQIKQALHIESILKMEAII